MGTENLISVSFTEEEKGDINGSLNTLRTKLLPKLISLTPEGRHELAKMSEKTVGFVDKSLYYAKTNSEFAPPYLNVSDLENDVAGVKILSEFEKPLEQILSALSDSIMLCGSEAYNAALTYYNSVKHASKQNVQTAKVIYEDLRTRFPQKGRKTMEVVNPQ